MNQQQSPYETKGFWPRFRALAAELYEFTAPKGDRVVRMRIMAAFACLLAAKLSNLVTPLLYGASVDIVNGELIILLNKF